MDYFADLHLHSRFARATSKSLTLPLLVAEAEKKGIGLLAIPDYTHPVWLKEVERQIVQEANGFYSLKDEGKVDKPTNRAKTHLVFSTELTLYFRRNEKGYRMHLLVIAPNLEAVKEINKVLAPLGNLNSDGRPIFSKDVILIVKTLFAVCPDVIVIPAHIWTPWFSLFGSRSGFDHFEDAFGEYSGAIPAVETGASSDPSNNWRVGELDNKNLVSFSDAHSTFTLGREMTLFRGDFSYTSFRTALFDNPVSPLSTDSKITGTIEFYPEEGKYHYSGHRKCAVVQSPAETKKYGSICPVCGKKLTLGVLHRIEELATRPTAKLQLESKDGWVSSKAFPQRPPFCHMVPLSEVIAQAYNVKSSRGSSVAKAYNALCDEFGNEWNVLANTPAEALETVVEKNVVVAIVKNRVGDVKIAPGFDGEYGKVTIALPGRKNQNRKKLRSLKEPTKATGSASLVVPAQARLL